MIYNETTFGRHHPVLVYFSQDIHSDWIDVRLKQKGCPDIAEVLSTIADNL
jgi:hypothetical protein